jgi:hypothetical protein
MSRGTPCQRHERDDACAVVRKDRRLTPFPQRSVTRLLFKRIDPESAAGSGARRSTLCLNSGLSAPGQAFTAVMDGAERKVESAAKQTNSESAGR